MYVPLASSALRTRTCESGKESRANRNVRIEPLVISISVEGGALEQAHCFPTSSPSALSSRACTHDAIRSTTTPTLRMPSHGNLSRASTQSSVLWITCFNLTRRSLLDAFASANFSLHTIIGREHAAVSRVSRRYAAQVQGVAARA